MLHKLRCCTNSCLLLYSCCSKKAVQRNRLYTRRLQLDYHASCDQQLYLYGSLIYKGHGVRVSFRVQLGSSGSLLAVTMT
jgi:hypothetical protein